MKKPKVICVDDNKECLFFLSLILEPEWDLKTFEDPGCALKDFEVFQPSVVIADYQMSPMNGLELLKNVQKLNPNAIRILFSGASSELQVFQDTRDQGVVSDVWLKPSDVPSISTKLKTLYSRNL